MFYHILCISAEETIHAFLKNLFFSAQPLRYLTQLKFELMFLNFLLNKIFFFEGTLNCNCTQVNMKLIVFKQNIIYHIQNYVQTSVINFPCFLKFCHGCSLAFP